MKIKHLKFLNKTFKIEDTKKIQRLPKPITYFTWSLGYELESDFFYEIKTLDNRIIYCKIVTFLNLFIVRSLFFEKKGGKYIRVYS